MPLGHKNQDSDYDDDVEIEDEYDGTSPKRRQHKGKGKASPPKNVGGGQDVQGYSWEATYTRTWDAVQEDEGGSLQGAIEELLARGRRRRYGLGAKPCMPQLTVKYAPNKGYSNPLGPYGAQLYAT
jgi:hypothetical protein